MLSELLRKHIKVDIDKMRKTNFLEVQRAFEAKSLDRVMKKHGQKSVTACPLCGGTEYSQEFKKYGSPLFRCGGCDLRFHGKIPSDVRDLYQDDDYMVYPLDGSDDHYNYRRERFGKERVGLLEKVCGNLSDKKILDIGCGNGYFLSALKETGAECVGAEFSEKWREWTKKKLGLPVYGEPLECFPEKNFDVITLFDVIEHIESPVPFMSAVRNLLKPKGRLLLYTPNFDSFSIKVMGEYSNNVDPCEHVILFSYKSLESLGKAVGFKIVYSETRGLDIHSILSYQEYTGQPRNPFLAKWLEELQVMIDASGCGDYVRVIYEKV